jgi:prevent-host-death family protein
MANINIHEAKTHLSRLLERVAGGEEIVIAKAGRPVARLVPYAEESNARHGGQWRSLVHIRNDFDEPLPPEIRRAFGGEGA